MKWENLGRREDGTFSVRNIKDEDVVCRCVGTTAGEIRQCVRNGAKTLEEVQAQTKAGTVCGFCKKRLTRIIEYEQLREPGPGDIEFIEKRPHDLGDPNRSVDEKCQELPVLEQQTTDWIELRSIMKGTVSKGFPDYSTEVNEWIKKFLRSDLGDVDYKEHFEKIRDRAIETLNRDEIITYMTWFIKEERSKAGLIAQALEDDVLPKLTKRLHELTK